MKMRWSGGWVGKGVIKWANTKFMAKMATKSKEVVEAHTQKKKQDDIIQQKY